MSSRVHDGGKRLQFGTGSPTPTFRHPYEKYSSRVSRDGLCRKSECNPGKVSDTPDLTPKKSFKNGQDTRKNGRKGLEERNTLICQTFLTENPFFGAYYPAIRPRSAEGVSNKGSERSRSLSTEFDDSKTYKIIYTGDSLFIEDQDLLQGSKSKKTDDIHHFHEHHHFFHDKNDESSNSPYYDKYQYAKAKEQTKNSITDPNKSFLKQPIQESCMIYQVEEERNQRLDSREPIKEKSQEKQRHLSRSSSKSGKRSSDNETYTVTCEHCQKLLRDHPNARIVGHENIPKRFSGESYDRRMYAPHGYNSDSVQKTSWKPANTFVAEPNYEVHRLNVSEENARWRRPDRANPGPTIKPFIPFNVESWPKKSRENVIPKAPSLESSVNDSDSRSLIFKCDHCKSIIETKARTRNRAGESSSSTSSSEKGRGGFIDKTGKVKNVSRENFPGKSQVKGFAGSKRSNVVGERKSSGFKGLRGSRTLVKKASSIQRVSGKVSNQKLSKSYSLSEKKKGSLRRTSRPSRVLDKRRSSGSRGSKEANGAEKRSSSYSAIRDPSFPNEPQNSRYNELRASSEMSKRNGSTRKGLKEPNASGKRVSSAFKESKDPSGTKQKSSVDKEQSKGRKVGSSNKTSRESAPPDKSSSYRRSVTTDKKTCSTYTEFGNTCSMNTRSISNRKESKDSGVRRSEKTESNLKKVETEKARLVQTEDRSMQTSSRKLISVDEKPSEVKRSSTASKTLSKTTSAKESKKSETAPGSMLNSASFDPFVISATTRGSATISRKTIVSRESPVIQVESTPETKQSSRVTGIRTEITDLKSQLDRLEALHNTKTEAPESNSSAVHEAIECPKHPIVVCTSTTYIMTKCTNDFGDRKSAASTTREPEKSPPKEKESPQETTSSVEEPSISKCQRFCCSEVNPPHRVGVGSAERTTKTRCGSPNFKIGPTRANCQFVGARITRAINKVCHCPNRDFLSRYCDTPGRTRSCDRSDPCRRLFGNGKNQRRTWLRGGLLTSYCNAREPKSVRCCPKCYNIAVPGLNNFVRRSRSDGVGESEKLIAYESYSTVLRDYRLHVEEQDQGESSKSPSSLGNYVEIDDTSRPGYFLRTSISDVCEYRNGSLIRLIGKSGWVVYTKKLFLEGKNARKILPLGECPKNEFALFPTSTSTTCSKSVVNIKQPGDITDVSIENKSVIFLNERQVWSDSSIYLPLALRALQEPRRNIQMEREKSTSTVFLGGNVRLRNQGISNFHEIVEMGNNYPNELYLLDCKSGADKDAKCADTSQNGLRCTCRQRRRKTRNGEGTSAKKEKVPVLFEEMKSQRDGSREGRKTSDVSVKYVFAERSEDSDRTNKVIWSTDGHGPKVKKPYVFGVSKGKKNRRNREHFSMNDKQRKYRWHRSNTQKNKENSHGTNKPQGDSLQNKCACCNCSPNHVCTPCEREEEELTGIRKLLRDIGITGLTLGFSRKAPYRRPGFLRPHKTEDEPNVSQNANYYEDIQTKEKEEVEVVEELREEIIQDEIGNSVTFLKKVNTEDKCCDCGKQIEQLLNQTELCRQSPFEPVNLKRESWEDEWNVESRKESAESTKKEPSNIPDVLDDISLQRRRIAECEYLLRQFEMQLEDVKRQNEAYTCKCEETPRQEEPQKQEEPQPPPPPPPPESQAPDMNSLVVKSDEVELKVLAERKCPIVKDDGYIRFEGKILTQLTNKKSTKSIGCGAVNEEYNKLGSTLQTSRKTGMVKNATQMTSDIFLGQKGSHNSECLLKEINLDTEDFGGDCKHACCTAKPKIEVCCERRMCTCEKCCNIHFIDKHYLPANCFKKCHGYVSENKVETAPYVPRPKKEIFTNTSGAIVLKKDEYTSVGDLFKSRKTEGVSRPCKATKKEDRWKTSSKAKKDEATSTVSMPKKDEATSTTCKPRKEEATTVHKTKKEEVVSHKEVPRPKVENAVVKSAPKVTKEEEKRVMKEEKVEVDRSRFKKESECVSENEKFVHESDLEKTPSEEDNEDEISKDLPRLSSVKPKTREIICECSKTEKCEDSSKCECSSKGIQCEEKRKMKRFCECGSKLKLIEDRLRALEERKKMSESTISSPKERKETSEESSDLSEKMTKITSESSIISEKEREPSSEVVSSVKMTEKDSSEESSTSYPKEKQVSEEESISTPTERVNTRVEAPRAKKETTESSTLTEKSSSSLENIESETDAEIKTKVITCHNMNFFDGGDPNVKTKCKCMEDSFCPFKYYNNNQDIASAKNIFFVTNIDLLRQWSGMYGCGEYSYCKNFWNANESALKPVKLPRDWRNVKTAVASFFRSCKLRKKNFTFKRRKKSDGESSANSAASKDNVTSGSEGSLLDDCSRSSMPLKRRSFHVLAKSPQPRRPIRERGKLGSDKKRRKRSRKRKIHS